MSIQVIRFVDQDNEIRIGVREQYEPNAHIIQVDSLATLLTYSYAKFREVIEAAQANAQKIAVVKLLAPVDQLTEVWAAGVTYKRSRAAREEESDHADVYSRVYDAARPELFFKSVAWRVVGDGEPIGVRSDSTINTPEPEIALVANSAGEIVGLTICDDVSSRSIEGENPLYLPQAKIYAGSCAVGPGIVPLWEISDLYALDISLEVHRAGETIWQGTTSTSQMHRTFEDLVRYLYLQMQFPQGAILSTGTGLVPEITFNLSPKDRVTVSINEVGTLTNEVLKADDLQILYK